MKSKSDPGIHEQNNGESTKGLMTFQRIIKTKSGKTIWKITERTKDNLVTKQVK